MVITGQIRVRSTRSERTWNARQSSLREVGDERGRTKDEQKNGGEEEGVYGKRKQKGQSVRMKGATWKMRRCIPQCGRAPDPIAMPVGVPKGSQRVSTNCEIISIGTTRHLPQISTPLHCSVAYGGNWRRPHVALISPYYFLTLSGMKVKKSKSFILIATFSLNEFKIGLVKII